MRNSGHRTGRNWTCPPIWATKNESLPSTKEASISRSRCSEEQILRILKDGEAGRKVVAAAVGTDDPFAGLTRIHIGLNWCEELTERVPVP